MLRFLFAALLLLHGLIHLMGFSKAFKYAELNQLNLPVSRPAGIVWLLVAVLFSISTVLFLLKKDSWWMLALPAVLLSQILIFQVWQDAKFGTVANALVLLGIALAWGSWNFNRMLGNEKTAFMPVRTEAKRPVVTREKTAGLPPIVQTWLERSDALGKPMPGLVQLRQTGRMRTAPDASWMPFEAEQYIRVDDPGFYWTTRVQAAPLFQLVGRDQYVDGKGFMLIKALSLIPVADARGPETDQGALLRYLAEIIWHPGSALAPYIQWEALEGEPLAAKATMRFGGIEAAGIFRFTATGDPESFEALRYYNRKSGATLEKWLIRMDPTGFREFAGVRIPARSTVFWVLDSGEFDWLELEISGLSCPD